MWLNDTKGLTLEGDTNRDVRFANGSCIDDPANFTRWGSANGTHGDDRYNIWFGPWDTWPAPAQAVVDAAGRRTAPPPGLPPALSPPKAPNSPIPVDCAPPPGGRTGRFAATPCSGHPSQLWLLDAGVTPGGVKPTSVKRNHRQGGCWEVETCGGSTVNTNWGCMALPNDTSAAHCSKDPCACHGGWVFQTDGVVASLLGTCLEVSAGINSTVVAVACSGKAKQKWLLKAAGTGFDGRPAWTVTQDIAGVAVCIDVDAP